MKRSLLLFWTFFLGLRLLAQPAFNDSIADSRYRLNTGAMTYLGVVGTISAAFGFVAAGHTSGEANRFWRMNGYWGLVNLGLAGVNYLMLRREQKKKYSFAENYKTQQRFEKIYLVNLGLDITYMTAGFLLNSKGNIETNPMNRDQLKGYGKSIFLQGALLLLMDGVMTQLHHRNTARMTRRLPE